MNRRALAAEAVGTAGLVAVVVGSGIMGWNLSNGNAAIALLANALATGCGLFVLISIFAPVSGAHFNPLVSILALANGTLSTTECMDRVVVQIGAAIAGTWLAHAMFDLQVFEVGVQQRSGAAQWLSETTATMGLVLTIGAARHKSTEAAAATVGAYIAAAYWFSASTSFANPAVTIARAMTTTFSGIALADAPMFVLAQCLGALLGHVLCRYFWPPKPM
ncbi:MAG TPA: aquaporin [Roseiflexaceae bacterium]|nr:aquaporin [Roseiflexaceae bacterium]